MGFSFGWAAFASVVLVAACGDSFTSVETTAAGAGASGGVTAATSGSGGDGARGGSSAEGGGSTSNGNGGAGGHNNNGGSGGGDACFSCQEAFASDDAVPPEDVCAGAQEDAYVALRECICNGDTLSVCGAECTIYCMSTIPLGDPCIECLDTNARCTSQSEACAAATQ